MIKGIFFLFFFHHRKSMIIKHDIQITTVTWPSNLLNYFIILYYIGTKKEEKHRLSFLSQIMKSFNVSRPQ